MAQDSNKEYFVSIEYKWGKQNGDDQDAESIGGQNWGYLSYDQSVACNVIVGEAMKKLIDDAVGLGLEMVTDQTMVDTVSKFKNK